MESTRQQQKADLIENITNMLQQNIHFLHFGKPMFEMIPFYLKF